MPNMREKKRRGICGVVVALCGSSDPLCNVTVVRQVYPGDDTQQPWQATYLRRPRSFIWKMKSWAWMVSKAARRLEIEACILPVLPTAFSSRQSICSLIRDKRLSEALRGGEAQSCVSGDVQSRSGDQGPFPRQKAMGLPVGRGIGGRQTCRQRRKMCRKPAMWAREHCGCTNLWAWIKTLSSARWGGPIGIQIRNAWFCSCCAWPCFSR